MKTNKTIFVASSSMLAAGMAQGAIVYHYVNQPYNPASSGYNLDLNGDGTNDYRVFFDANNASKPCVLGSRTGPELYPGSFPNPTPYVLNELDMNPGYPASPENNANQGVPVIPADTTITSEFTVGAYLLSIGDPAGDKWGKNQGYLYHNGENTTVGQWPSGTADTVGYVALAMVDNSVSPANTNYGWVQVELDYSHPTAKLTVIDYAYQTIANSNLVSGQVEPGLPFINASPTNQTVVA